ncbi:hypothetical protein ACHAQA_010161 [Verticillium albo-atrum]
MKEAYLSKHLDVEIRKVPLPKSDPGELLIGTVVSGTNPKGKAHARSARYLRFSLVAARLSDSMTASLGSVSAITTSMETCDRPSSIIAAGPRKYASPTPRNMVSTSSGRRTPAATAPSTRSHRIP